MKTIKEWNDILVEMTDKTDYCVLTKRSINSPVVAIVPKEKDSPQIIAIYPKKTKNPGLVLMYDVYNRRKIQNLVGEPNRIHSNRPHFSNVEEQTIIDVCKSFLLKD